MTLGPPASPAFHRADVARDSVFAAIGVSRSCGRCRRRPDRLEVQGPGSLYHMLVVQSRVWMRSRLSTR